MKKRIWQIICVALTAGLIAFIFAHSIQNAEASSEKSTGVYVMVQQIFAFFGGEFPMSHDAFRKLAHFLEYMALGFMLIVTTRSFTKNVVREITKPLLAGILIPIIDETIQLASPGRSGEVRDVWIDFFGVLAGVAVTLILILAVKKIKEVKRGDKEFH